MRFFLGYLNFLRSFHGFFGMFEKIPGSGLKTKTGTGSYKLYVSISSLISETHDLTQRGVSISAHKWVFISS